MHHSLAKTSAVAAADRNCEESKPPFPVLESSYHVSPDEWEAVFAAQLFRVKAPTCIPSDFSLPDEAWNS